MPRGMRVVKARTLFGRLNFRTPKLLIFFPHQLIQYLVLIRKLVLVLKYQRVNLKTFQFVEAWRTLRAKFHTIRAQKKRWF